MRNLIGNIIKEAGYTDVHFAGDGREAINIASELKPDIITLDISMPEINGLDAIEGILTASPCSKIIMVTAVTDQLIVKQAIQKGAVDFVKKPFDRFEIEDVLRRHI